MRRLLERVSLCLNEWTQFWIVDLLQEGCSSCLGYDLDYLYIPIWNQEETVVLLFFSLSYLAAADVSEKMENWKSEWMVWWRNLKLGDRKQQKTSRGRGYELNSTSWEWVSVHPLHFLAKGRLGGSVNKFVRGKGRLIGRHNIESKYWM